MTDGFTPLPNWLIRGDLLSQNQLTVYLALASRLDRYGRAFPSVKTIAHDARVSESTAKRTIRELVKLGIVQVESRTVPKRGQTSNVYKVALFDRQLPVHALPQVSVTGAPGQSDRRAPVILTDEEDPVEEDPGEGEVTSRLQAGPTRRDHDRPTSAQAVYVRDLWIHHQGAAPSEAQEREFEALSRADAAKLIGEMLSASPRGDDYIGPEDGEPAYAALSEQGRAWADRRMKPDGYNYGDSGARDSQRRSA